MNSAVVIWSSNDTGVARVSAQGLVTAVNNGVARITAASGSITATATVTVSQTAGSIVIEPMEAKLMSIGQTVQLNATVLDESGQPVAGAVLTWQSSDIAVAMVNAQGLVTAVQNGVARITARSGNVFESVEVTVQVSISVSDREALVAIYHSTGGPNWTNNTNWLSDQPLGQWAGVQTNAEGRVVRLDGTFNNLSGTIPPEIGQLDSLRFLILYGNELSGEIPVELGRLNGLQFLYLDENQLSGGIPVELGQLGMLSVLSVNQNQLTGEIPPELGQLGMLSVLSVNQNQLTGEIPPELGQLGMLVGLSVNQNQLTGEIPPELGQLKKLEVLNLGHNQLTGEIPPELGQLGSLRDLIANHNQLTGEIPPEIGLLDSLLVLHFFDNQLMGEIPTEIGQLNKLRDLNIGHNHLIGEIPSEIGLLGDLQKLDLSYNEGLVGPVPEEIANLDNLLELLLQITNLCVPIDPLFNRFVEQLSVFIGIRCSDTPNLDRDALVAFYHSTGGPNWTKNTNWLSKLPIGQWDGVVTNDEGKVIVLEPAANMLTGTIAPEIGQLDSLRNLTLSDNQLTGEIPAEIGQLASLEYLYLGNNSLTGEIPAEIGQLGRLRELGLYQNQLTGTIPSEIGQLDSLLYLSLYGNQLTGIPEEIGQLQNLLSLTLAANRLTEIPPEIGDLKALVDLTLQANRITGEIPPEIAQLSFLQSLLLHENDLSGKIPPEIGQMRNLATLWLDTNQLTGEIPPEIGQLVSLQSLSISGNQLIGEIPPDIGQLQALRFLNLGDNQLSGEIPTEIGQLANLEELTLTKNELTGPIPSEIGNLESLRFLLLKQNTISGRIPPEIGQLEALQVLDLRLNPNLAGPIPDEILNLQNLEQLLLTDTPLCAPLNEEFDDFLRTLTVALVPRCDLPTGSLAYLIQATQSVEFPVPLVAGEDALLRVFVMADEMANVDMPQVRASFYQNNAVVHTVEIQAQDTTVPSTLDAGSLSASANAIIPGSVVMPGLELVVEIGPDESLDPAAGIQSRIPETGRMTIEVFDVPTLDLTLVPLVWSEDPDYSVVTATAGLAPDDDLFRFTRDLLPVGNFELTIRDQLFTSVDPVFKNRAELLHEILAIQEMDGLGGHYMGILRSPGGAQLGGTAVTVSDLDESTIAHELGHDMSLNHAPCGNIQRVDFAYPYPDGNIGAWGYDLLTGTMVSPDTPDLMSYCGPPDWISDYNFSKAIRYRQTDDYMESISPAASSVPGNTLLVWGGIDENGDLFLKPSFAVDAPASIPANPGPYQITGVDVEGGVLLSVGFNMSVIKDMEVGAFAFTIPVNPSWLERLVQINLSGPEGFASLDADGETAMALIRDPNTGQVLGFMRDVQSSSIGLMPTEPGLDIIISTGIPDSVVRED